MPDRSTAARFFITTTSRNAWRKHPRQRWKNPSPSPAPSSPRLPAPQSFIRPRNITRTITGKIRCVINSTATTAAAISACSSYGARQRIIDVRLRALSERNPGMAATNKQVLRAERPRGAVAESHFKIVESAVPQPGAGELLVRNLYLSLDPYMRGRMDDAKSYAPSVQIGEVMVGGTVGEVIASDNPRFKVGDFVEDRLGWQQYAVATGKGMRKVDPDYVPLPAYLGAVGMPGVTAWIGLNEHGRPKAGETVVVSAASGAVGGIVGQLAKMKDCRA